MMMMTPDVPRSPPRSGGMGGYERVRGRLRPSTPPSPEVTPRPTAHAGKDPMVDGNTVKTKIGEVHMTSRIEPTPDRDGPASRLRFIVSVQAPIGGLRRGGLCAPRGPRA